MERKSYDRDLPKGREAAAAIAIRDGELSDGGCRMMSIDVVVHWGALLYGVIRPSTCFC